jgi:mannose-6-phosphate isomerase-like protein (cupin superfamily)
MSSNRQERVAPVRRAFAVASGEDRVGKPLSVVGDEIRIKIASADTNDAFAVVEDVTPPNGGPPLHIHYEQDEWWYVLEGEFLFEVDGEQIRVGAGATVFAPKGSRHAFQNVGGTPGRTIVTVVPGGLDRFFEEVDATVQPDAPPDPVVISALFRKHGMELLGPPLACRDKAA